MLPSYEPDIDTSHTSPSTHMCEEGQNRFLSLTRRQAGSIFLAAAWLSHGWVGRCFASCLLLQGLSGTHTTHHTQTKVGCSALQRHWRNLGGRKE
mmetsp:Transcript_5772/g.13808  ORF Transcript_5772/g.13808 Transcript_5772/m.13808 type:complete len:95 (-) Transcript_5772:493-777(-)